MAPLVPPPPALTLEQAQDVERRILAQATPTNGEAKLHRTRSRSILAKILGTKGATHAFTGKAFVTWAINTELATNTDHAIKVGQALLDHRLAHHVTDDYEFENADHEYAFISQETPENKAYHTVLGNIIAKQDEMHQGKLQLHSKTFWGSDRWVNVYAVLDNTVRPQVLHLYKGYSAASPPFASLGVEDCECHMRECMDCKTDWYCFNLRALKNDKMQQVTLCADHSKRQEGWMDALSGAGVRFERELIGDDLSSTKSLFELKARKLNSNHLISFDEYKGKVCLVVNVSSKCGLSPRDYPQLAALYAKYGAQGFEVLAFPTNNFGNQEPGTEEEIQQFVKQFGVTFPMFEKVDVNGSNAHPVFRFLKGKLGGVLGSSIKWNFTKFLCDRDGVPVKRFGPSQPPNSFENDIAELVNQPH